MRLNKYLAKCGLGSRRKCDLLIESCQIKINGKINSNFSYQVKDNDVIQYKNKIINIEEEDYVYILNKPHGYISTSNDTSKRKIIIDLIPTNVRLFNVGRLDYDTTGVILLTNNGDIANRLLHPRYNISKKYYAETKTKLTKKNILDIKNGINIDSIGIVKADISLLTKSRESKYIWDIILREGKNREIKRIFNFYNIQVNKLHRYDFAGIKLGNLKTGEYRRISLKKFLKQVGIK